jgi:hypothetical protein
MPLTAATLIKHLQDSYEADAPLVVSIIDIDTIDAYARDHLHIHDWDDNASRAVLNDLDPAGEVCNNITLADIREAIESV